MKQPLWSAVVLSIFCYPALAENPLTDKCSGKVRIPPHFTDGAFAPGTVELVRGAGNKGWTAPIAVTVAKGDCCSGEWFPDCGKFRWYCLPAGQVEWVAEQSKCDGNDGLISARLGPDRLVNFNCLGNPFTPPICTQSGGTGTGTFPGLPGGPCQLHDICQKGGRCNLSTHMCETFSSPPPGCGNAGEPCCPSNPADPIGCPGGGQCSGGVCQLCGGNGELCCGQVTHLTCSAGLACGGSYCSNTGSSGSPITALDELDPAAAVAFGGVMNVANQDGDRFDRVYSLDNGQQWFFDAKAASNGSLTPDNRIGQGQFVSGPAAVAGSGGQLHVFGRGSDNKIWRAYSPDSGKSWTVAWVPMGQGTFTSAPATAISADGKQLHLFGRGNDNRIWRAYSPDGGNTWTVAFVPVGWGSFTSAPAAAISPDGKQLHLFGRGNDNRIWRAYSPDGGTTWPVAWTPVEAKGKTH